MNLSRPSPTVVLAIASFLWGLTWWPLKALHSRGVDGIPLTFIAYGFVGLGFLPLYFRRFGEWRNSPWRLVAIALLGGTANVSFAAALVYGNVVRVMVLFYLLPVWGVLGGRIFLGESINRVRALAMSCALVGAFLVLGGPEIFREAPSLVDGLAILAGFAFAMNNICFRASQELSVPIKIGAMFTGCALVAGAAIASGVQHLPSDVAANTWGLVIAFGLFILLITAGSQYGVNHMEAGRSAIIMILELLGAVASSVLLLGTRLGVVEVVGGVLIVSASLLEASGGDVQTPERAVAG